MSCLEHQILEHMAFINKNVVNTHRMKVYAVILVLLYACFQAVQLDCQILLSFFKSLLHLATAPTHGAFLQSSKTAFHIHQFLLHNITSGLVRLGNLGELVMRQNDAIPIVVLNL